MDLNRRRSFDSVSDASMREALIESSFWRSLPRNLSVALRFSWVLDFLLSINLAEAMVTGCSIGSTGDDGDPKNVWITFPLEGYRIQRVEITLVSYISRLCTSCN